MKKQVVSELSNPELKERLMEEQLLLSRLNMNHAISPIENPNKIKEQRKTIARIKTEIRKRELTA